MPADKDAYNIAQMLQIYSKNTSADSDVESKAELSKRTKTDMVERKTATETLDVFRLSLPKFYYEYLASIPIKVATAERSLFLL